MSTTATDQHGDSPPSVVLGQPSRWRMIWITSVWGACFLFVSWGLRDAPILWFASLRALVAGAALVGFGALQRRPQPRGIRAWGWITTAGLVNVTIAFAAMFAGVAGLATGVAAVLANAQPLLILLPAWWLYGEAISHRTAAGLSVGFIGLLLVALPGGGGSGAALSLLSAIAVTGGTLLARRLAGMDLVLATGWHLVIGGVVLAGLALLVDGPAHIEWTPRFLVSLAFLALVGTAATTVAWFHEANRARLDALTSWTFLAPVVGLALAVSVLGERPGGWTATGLAATLTAMWVVLRSGAGGRHGASDAAARRGSSDGAARAVHPSRY
ncbi:hypothetical protein N864_23465 [Intrasporangium chromatireducens Q5-1]|uniref:EamA domain-containing protein n=1 Tax=Intrasporangium chromatireducens Q5-1 TaxID=584657 RepID=W9GV27_9MICO|nr:EamA family transporter [Intrasporangium chromatireducens]EWT07729.1 hypothetical protein N864_23465 [Intrasporangium chromatireducens Q5-1]